MWQMNVESKTSICPDNSLILLKMLPENREELQEILLFKIQKHVKEIPIALFQSG